MAASWLAHPERGNALAAKAQAIKSPRCVRHVFDLTQSTRSLQAGGAAHHLYVAVEGRLDEEPVAARRSARSSLGERTLVSGADSPK